MTQLHANPYLKCGMVKAATAKLPAAKKKTAETLGDRIRRFRKVKGLTQTELGEIVGISQRLMTYYETQGGRPAADSWPASPRRSTCQTDVLLGRSEADDPRAAASPQTLRLWRRLRRIEEIPPQDQKTILKMIDALADRSAK
jgi:DNA-binding XRE family transcriptional regulator